MKHAKNEGKKGKIRRIVLFTLVIILVGYLVYIGILLFMSIKNENIYEDLYQDIIEYEK